MAELKQTIQRSLSPSLRRDSMRMSCPSCSLLHNTSTLRLVDSIISWSKLKSDQDVHQGTERCVSWISLVSPTGIPSQEAQAFVRCRRVMRWATCKLGRYEHSLWKMADKSADREVKGRASSGSRRGFLVRWQTTRRVRSIMPLQRSRICAAWLFHTATPI